MLYSGLTSRIIFSCFMQINPKLLVYFNKKRLVILESTETGCILHVNQQEYEKNEDFQLELKLFKKSMEKQGFMPLKIRQVT